MARELRVLAGMLARRLRDQTPPGDLTWPQIEVLGRLERDGPTTVSRLAKAEGVRGQSMGATVVALEELGLIQRAPHPKDGRQTILSLTDAGLQMINQNRSSREDWLSHVIETRLSAEEKIAFAATLKALTRIVEM